MRLQRSNRELWAALLIVVLITTGYLTAARGGPLRASSLLGHSLGIVGFVLMLATETLYSLRKRSRGFGWGRMSTWLSAHIITGIVGPYMVLLHSAWKYNGLAGLVMLLTLVVVLSGFLGRYIYTAVPRTANGAEVEAAELKAMIADAEAELQQWVQARPQAVRPLTERLATLYAEPTSDLAAVLGRALLRWSYRRQWARETRRLDKVERAQAAQLQSLFDRRRRLRRQQRSIAAARRMLSLWHTVHVPLGVVLFVTAFVHVAAVLYFVNLGR